MKSFVIRPLNAAGQVTARPMPPLVRNDWSFIYLVSGEILTEIGERPYLLGKGDCALIPPSVRYSVKYFKDAIGYMGAFSEDVLSNVGHKVLRLKDPSVLSVPVEDNVFFSELMIRLSRFPEDVQMIRSLLEVFLCQFDNVIPPSVGNASQKICSAYLEMVFDNSRPFVGVAGYAAELGVTPSHLNRAVKSESGRSAGEWLANARISLARNLLRAGDLPVLEIADRLGFEDASYFARFFRKMTGMTPSEYRRLV